MKGRRRRRCQKAHSDDKRAEGEREREEVMEGAQPAARSSPVPKVRQKREGGRPSTHFLGGIGVTEEEVTDEEEAASEGSVEEQYCEINAERRASVIADMEMEDLCSWIEYKQRTETERKSETPSRGGKMKRRRAMRPSSIRVRQVLPARHKVNSPSTSQERAEERRARLQKRRIRRTRRLQQALPAHELR